MNDIISYLLPIGEALIRSYCFYRFAKPFVNKKQGAFYGSAAYFLTIFLLYTTRLSMDTYVIYGAASLVMLLALCRIDQKNYIQKLFLTVIFFSLSWFAAAMAEILYDNLYEFALSTDYIRSRPYLSSALYAAMCMCDLIFEFVLILIGIWQVLKVYTDRAADLEKKELLMLSLPSLMGLTGYEIMRYYRVFYAVNAGEMEKTYDGLTMLFCVMCDITIIVVIALYRNIKTKQAENLQTQLLATQIDNIKKHVEQVESLYWNINSVRHDMTNHILILERLYEGNQTEEAKAYGRNLKEQLAGIAGQIKSGNPVTDVILQEQKKEAAKRAISFRSDFFYPADSNINVFDISVALHNALQNAIENTKTGGDITVTSYRQNNAYMIEIRNSFTGSLQWDAGNGLLLSSKENKEGHGYGLSNIRRVAEKYAGDIDITFKDGTFCLCIMMMTE